MANKRVSELLSKVLEDIGVSEKMINRRKTTFAENEVVASLSVMLLGAKGLYLRFGSQIEGTTTLGMDSDIDSLSYLTNWPVILATEDWSVGKKNLLLLTDQHCPPQHCYLQRLREDAPEPLTNLPELDHVKDSKGRIFIKNTYVSNSVKRRLEKAGQRFIQHGPSVSYSDTADYVFCFHCEKLPDVCSSWLNRARPGHWPPENIKIMAKDVGIFLLPLGHLESDDDSVEWRFSTSETERLLMLSLNTCQIKVYILLKMLWTLIHNGWYSNEQFTSRNKIEYTIVGYLADQYFGYINHSLNHYLVAANKVRFEQAYNVINTNLSMLADRMQTADQIKRNGTMIIIKYLSSVIATMQASQWFGNGLLILPDETYRLFDVSLDFDLASCKLKLASVYYRMKEYHKAADILSRIEKSFQPCVISACHCRKGSQIRLTKAFKKKALASTNEDTL